MSPLSCLFVALGAWRRKGLPRVMDAVAEADRRQPGACELVVLGAPGLGDDGVLAAHRGLLERGVVHAPGYQADVAPAFMRSDVLLVGSHYETCSLVMLDALKYGLAVIAAPVHGADAMVCEGVNGFRTTGRADEMADRLLELAADRPRLARMKGESLLLAGRFSAARLALETEQVYRRAMA